MAHVLKWTHRYLQDLKSTRSVRATSNVLVRLLEYNDRDKEEEQFVSNVQAYFVGFLAIPSADELVRRLRRVYQ
jgi:hypothetical protein